jgi:GT2 family glycosyltransferase
VTTPYYVGIPTLNRYDLLAKCINAILAGDSLPQLIYVIDNGGKWEGHPSPLVRNMKSPKNFGVAASWNLLTRLTSPLPCVILNDDVEVGPTLLRTMVDGLADHYFLTADTGNAAFCGFVCRSNVYNTVGPFDEMFWPAYHEDADYHWRMKLAGFPILHQPLPVEVGLKSQLISQTKAAMTPAEKDDLERHWRDGRTYYVRKWGGPPGEEQFKVPFNYG